MDSLRISDADREAAVDVLAEHYATGRLTKDEFDERSDAVWSAKTRGDLAPIFVDMPHRSPARSGRTPARLPAGAQRPRRWPFPLVPVLIALVVLVAVTRLPFLLLLVVLFFCFGRAHHGWGPRRY